ncbi:MAG: hypothetical protein HOE53_04555 [Candidatus Magasanikbacteria bacterium]|jgi:hypothetical protein|nr:hypothetical protein [Candidatus Magasanikbacteria bacterium]
MILPYIHEYYTKRSGAKDHILLHIAEPDANDTDHGLFFAIISLPSEAPHTIVEDAQDVVGLMERLYFSTQRTDDKRPFEIATEVTNAKHATLVKTLLENTSCAIGVIHKKNIAFVAQGEDVYIDLLTTNDDGDSSTPLAPTAKQHTDRFSAVTEGTLNTKSYLHISTFHARDIFTPERMLKLLKQLSAKELAAHVQKSLDAVKHAAAGGCILQIEKTTEKPPAHPVRSEKSLNSLKAREQQTAETLRPSIFQTLSKTLATDDKKANTRTTRARKRDGDGTSYAAERGTAYAKLVFRAVLLALGGIALILRHIFFAIISGIKILYYLLTNAKGKRSIMQQQFKEQLRRKRNWFAAMPMLSKLLLVAATSFTLIFVSSIGYLRYNANKVVALKQSQTTLIAAQEHLASAKSASIYGNDTDALNELHQAQAQFSSISERDADELSSYGSTQTAISELLQSLRKEHIIESTVLLADSALSSFTELTAADDRMYVFGEQESSYAWFTPFKDAALQNVPFEAISDLTFSSADETYVLAGSAAGEIARIESSESGLTAQQISFPDEGVVLASMAQYGGRLYTLAKPFAIYKHAKTQLGFDRGLSWISAQSDTINEPVDLTIDGSVYVLSPTEVFVFMKGAQQSFRLESVDPAMTGASSIYSSPESEYLFILEPDLKRVLVFSKSGSFIAQFTSPEWNHPTAMSINEEERTITVLDGSSVFQISFLL